MHFTIVIYIVNKLFKKINILLYFTPVISEKEALKSVFFEEGNLAFAQKKGSNQNITQWYSPQLYLDLG